MNQEEPPLQSEAFKVNFALTKLSTGLREIAENPEFSIKSRERLFKAASLIHEVFIEMVNGENDRQKEVEFVQNEASVLQGQKRYIFDPNVRGEKQVWVEQGERRYALPKRDPYKGFSWGYLGSGPHTLALALVEDCFGHENIPSSAQSDIYSRVYTLVARAPQGKSHLLYEHHLRACVGHVASEGSKGL
jgi:hypothetical protein